MKSPENISKANFIILLQPTNNFLIRTNTAKYKVYVHFMLYCATSCNIFWGPTALLAEVVRFYTSSRIDPESLTSIWILCPWRPCALQTPHGTSN